MIMCPSASQQSGCPLGHVCVIEGVPDVCAQFDQALDRLWTFISQTEESYQRSAGCPLASIHQREDA
jgi:hypothetical protein